MQDYLGIFSDSMRDEERRIYRPSQYVGPTTRTRQVIEVQLPTAGGPVANYGESPLQGITPFRGLRRSLALIASASSSSYRP